MDSLAEEETGLPSLGREEEEIQSVPTSYDSSHL